MEVFPIAKKEMQINEQIRDNELRVIGPDGAQLGVMSAREAQKIADDAGLDLVKIAPTAVPPVCRVMDYGKYRFEQAKKEKEARKNQHVVDIKEVRLGLNTDVGDFNTLVNRAAKFLQGGDKVKVSIRFRGREMGHPEMGLESMKRFAEALQEVATVEKPAKLEGRHMLMFLAPKATK
ncbi:MAG: translation initiation factor IF-3 [Clostridia bacterium]|nr:translation initiation factor IF-3 [Clostridia bacterium]